MSESSMTPGLSYLYGYEIFLAESSNHLSHAVRPKRGRESAKVSNEAAEHSRVEAFPGGARFLPRLILLLDTGSRALQHIR
jgi:hypothetical protein